MADDFVVKHDESTGLVQSVTLFGEELLDQSQPCAAELLVNGLPLKTRLYPRSFATNEGDVLLKGERWLDHFTGWGLVISRDMGLRTYGKHPAFGVHYTIRREQADQVSLPCPGPGGPPIEAPLYVDTFTLMNWNWKFWGEDTRMIFSSSHSSGPTDEFGHVGYDNGTPEECKKYMQNVWRRIYPGVMVFHGGVFYNEKTENWVAITCRRPQVGYILNTESAGRGVSYDFTLHAEFKMGEHLTMPEVKIYYGKTKAEMWTWMADYATHYYKSPPEWVHKTLWLQGLAWNNKPSWTEQADEWEHRLDAGEGSGVSYCLVTNRPLHSGTTPLGYDPDPNHGPKEEFVAMCRRLADRGVPLLIWMSHSGLMYRGGPDIEDDWFIKGIDGRVCAAWGNEDQPTIAHPNPGHPGYIEYTKKWIKFYIQECGAKGIWFDCLGWAFPADFTPRPFMRYPGDTNRMAIKFMDEIYAYIKELDPEAVMGGEGTTFDGPVNLPSIHTNPVRSADGMGPRDFMLELNNWTKTKRIVIDQAPSFSVASGMIKEIHAPEMQAKNRYLTKLLKEKGGSRAFVCLPGELAILASDNLLIVPTHSEDGSKVFPEFKLTSPWDKISKLIEETDGSQIAREADGAFRAVPPGIYKML